jgi:Fe-S cluster biogenesis protein NfuA
VESRDASANDPILKVCRDILAPLVRADGGEMFLVSATSDNVHIHLAGACSGCPGASVTREKILAPIILGAAPKARLVVTTGVHAPAGATKIA